jgi:hypothetical protein
MLKRTLELKQNQAKINETDLLDMSLYHSISYPYQPNEQCLLGEMPIK